MTSATEQILDAINYAIDKKTSNLEYDSTLICTVVKVYPDTPNTYQLSYKNTTYTVTTKNITLALQDTVHLVIPKGNFSNKYVLEDTSLNHQKEYIASLPDDTGTYRQIITSTNQPANQAVGDLWYKIIT